MKYFKIIFLIAGLFSFFKGGCQQFYLIPPQTIKPYQILGYERNGEYFANRKENNYQMNVDSLVISKQISLGEYKIYLEAIKKDSSQKFYISQFPDSTITSPKNYIA